MESAFLPFKQIKPITFLFISLVKTVISLTQEMHRCMCPRSVLTWRGFHLYIKII